MPHYELKWYREDEAATFESARRILPYLVDRYSPKSMIDVGCGPGVWLQAAKQLGVSDLTGLDGPHIESLPVGAELIRADLADRFPTIERRYDLALCLEVGEHLPIGRAELLVDFLATLGNTILFSAAIPGQAGHQHLNNQWATWWAEKFRRRGYRPSDWLRREIWDDSDILVFYRQNVIVLEYCPASPYSIFQDVVHPDFYRYKLEMAKVHGWGI